MAITKNNNDVNIASSESNKDGTGRAVYWKSGVKVILSHDDSTNKVFATDITIQGQDVYICDHVRNTAVYWKNGIRTTLETQYSRAYGIAVSSNDIYVIGVKGNVPTYWKSGIETILEHIGGSANAIAISGEDVYIIGAMSDLAVIWKNGESKYLGPNNSSNIAIAISGKDIYVAGSIFSTFGRSANVWKNGIKTELSFVPAALLRLMYQCPAPILAMQF